jgi:hypothetical protein
MSSSAQKEGHKVRAGVELGETLELTSEWIYYRRRPRATLEEESPSRLREPSRLLVTRLTRRLSEFSLEARRRGEKGGS